MFQEGKAGDYKSDIYVVSSSSRSTIARVWISANSTIYSGSGDVGNHQALFLDTSRRSRVIVLSLVSTPAII